MQSIRILLLLALAWATAGCATANGPADNKDPLEGLNRAVYSFNDGFDRVLLRPVAEAYDKHLPRPVHTGISNFFSNLDDVVVIVNDLLQFKLKQAGSDAGRVTFNTTVGLLGFIDVATPMDLPKHNEDFGQTLGYWGIHPGPYLVLPFLGPSDLRDGVGRVGDYQVDPVHQIDHDTTRYEAIALRVVDTRAGLLKATRVMEQAALDPYTFTRESYLQRRRNLVYDGNPPAPDFEGMFDDEAPTE